MISDDKWFGFFSPKLQEKTQITSEDVWQEIQEIDEQYDVCSFSAHWSDIAFFQMFGSMANIAIRDWLTLARP